MTGLLAEVNAKATCCCAWAVWASVDPLPDPVSDAAEIAVLPGAELLTVAVTSICCFCSEAVLLLRSLGTPDTLS